MNSVLPILKRNDISEALKVGFIIDQYLSVLVPESYTNIQQFITLKSKLHNLFSNLKNEL